MHKTGVKIAAFLVLLAVLIGISVIKSMVSANRREADLETIKREYFATQDSVYRKMLSDSTRRYLDSLIDLEAFYQSNIDSLNDYYDSVTADLQKQVKEAAAVVAKKNEDPPPAKKQSKPKVDPLIKKVKLMYQRKIGDLPRDLTAYEKRVALKEITVEISKEYKISPDSVTAIVNSSS
ncbi:MAG: hypothetical protein JW763_04430 [candidate division Zixibacteria bacterium]|nr:hypothetical protein [candidate division Zixibacteria bacterium]